MVGVQPTDVGMEHTHDSRGNRCHFSYVKHGEDSPVSQDRKVKSISVCQKIPKFQSCSCLSACPSAHASRLLVLRGVRKQISIYQSGVGRKDFDGMLTSELLYATVNEAVQLSLLMQVQQAEGYFFIVDVSASSFLYLSIHSTAFEIGRLYLLTAQHLALQ